VRRAKRSTRRDGFRNTLEFALTTRGRWLWTAVQSVGWLRTLVNRRLIAFAAGKMQPRPDPFSTRSDYTSWDSLTDRSYDGRHLGPVVREPASLPPVDRLAELFRRPSPTLGDDDLCEKCEKSTVLFAYFAQWFTDGFLRSDRPQPPNTTPDPRRNNSTHEIDLCQIYGLTAQATWELRAHEGGLMACQGAGEEIFPPFLYAADGTRRFPSITVARESMFDPQDRPYLFAIGTDTGNVQIGHVMMNTLFLREHNRLARELEAAYGWDDERVFQTARNINIVMLIKIVIDEYINHIAPYRFRLFLDGTKGFARAPWMRTNRMASDFNLLYRWHSLIPSELLAGGGMRPLEETALNPRFVPEHGLGSLFEEASSQRAGRVGLFNTDPYLLPAEKASIEKGRAVQLASYNDYRASCGYPRVTDFDQISGDPRVREGLAGCYGSPDEIEFYVGLFAEDPRPNSVLPSLVGRMVGVDAFSQALTNPLLAPRVYNEATLSRLGWQEIEKTNSLSDILNRNVTRRDRPYAVTMTRAGWERR
jgi:prostaglandin-endoperoxide synthase 2